MKILYFLLATLLLGCVASADTHYATTSSLSNVQSAVDAASDYDVVQLPLNDDETWNGKLTIAQGITLDLCGNTITTSSNLGWSGYGMVHVAPASQASFEKYRITNGTLDANDIACCISASGSYTLNNNTRLRIDHMTLTGATKAVSAHRAIVNNGPIYGVYDNVHFEDNYLDVTVYGGSWHSWLAHHDDRAFGSENNVYVEDCWFNHSDGSYDRLEWCFADGGWGGRYILRYNDMDAHGHNLNPAFDIHGNQDGSSNPNFSFMVNEVYGNYIDQNGYGGYIVDQRGSKLIAFNNYEADAGSPPAFNRIREEFNDSMYIYGNSNGGTSNTITTSYSAFDAECDDGGNYSIVIHSGVGAGQTRKIVSRDSSSQLTVTPAWNAGEIPTASFWYVIDDVNTWIRTAQHAQDTYSFNNRYNANLLATNDLNEDDWWRDTSPGELGTIANDPPFLTENLHFWWDDTTFDGTVGVGYGTFENMPDTCTVGVGYWATDQNFVDISNYVGREPVEPITGTLYRATATNTWTAYYTPYTYPHPLRSDPDIGDNPGEEDTTDPEVTAFTIDTTSDDYTIGVTSFTATDNVQVTGYQVTESSSEPVSGWLSSAPATYTLTSQTNGIHTLYGWAKDAAGNTAYVTDTVTVDVPEGDTTDPTIMDFSIEPLSGDYTIEVLGLVAGDNVGVTGYKVTESSSEPVSGWSGSAPSSYTMVSQTEGVHTLYGWAKDAAGNAVYATDTVTITLPEGGDGSGGRTVSNQRNAHVNRKMSNTRKTVSRIT